MQNGFYEKETEAIRMFFFISKILSYLLNPLFWIFTLLIVAYFLKNKKIAKKIFLISLITFYLFSNRFICDEFLRIWEVKYPSQTSLNIQYDAAIVLGGSIVNYDYQTDRLIFRKNADRFLQAIDLYKSGKVKKILLTGGPGHLLYRDQYEAAFLKKYLLKIEIPLNDILLDSLSDNTRENAIESKKILQNTFPNGSNNLLITSTTHMKRGKACFDKAGIRTTAYPACKITGMRLYNIDHLFIPHLDSFDYWSDMIHEWVGYLTYKIMGYI